MITLAALSFIAAMATDSTQYMAAVETFETCQARAAYQLLAPDDFAACQALYTTIKLSHVSPELVAEYVANMESATPDYGRMHEISLIGYAGWTEWKAANTMAHKSVVTTAYNEARAAYIEMGGTLSN